MLVSGCKRGRIDIRCAYCLCAIITGIQQRMSGDEEYPEDIDFVSSVIYLSIGRS